MNLLCKILFVFRCLFITFFLSLAWQQLSLVKANTTVHAAAWALQLPAHAEHYNCAGIIQNAAKTHGLSPELLTAVIHAESNFNPRAHSHMGAKGLMQINEATRKHLKIVNIWDPAQNVAGGAFYLRQLLNRFHGNVRLALAAYNAGPGAVSKYRGIPPYRETQNYVRKVMNLMKHYGGEVAVAHI